MLSNEDFAVLLPRVALGDRAAFEQVYRAACGRLLGVAFRILNSRERAEEVLQEAFMNVWNSAGGFDASVAGPMTWLINIVRNKAIDALRSGKTERASTLALDEEAMAVAADPTQQPQALLERSLEKLRITGCMGELHSSVRQCEDGVRKHRAQQNDRHRPDAVRIRYTCVLFRYSPRSPLPREQRRERCDSHRQREHGKRHRHPRRRDKFIEWSVRSVWDIHRYALRFFVAASGVLVRSFPRSACGISPERAQIPVVPARGRKYDPWRPARIDTYCSSGGNMFLQHFSRLSRSATALLSLASMLLLASCGGGGGGGGPTTPSTPGGGGGGGGGGPSPSAWTTRLDGARAAVGVSGLAWNGSRLVAVGDSISASSDFLIWNEREAFGSYNDVAWNAGLFVAVGDSGRIETSTDGLTWTIREFCCTFPANSAVVSSGSLWVVVGSSGSVRTSPDGITWTSRTTPTTKQLNSVAWTGSQFVAVGESGTVITSPDGVNWTARTSGATDTFTAVGANASLIVASTFPFPGSTSALYTSPDGITWTPRNSGIGTFNSIIYAGGKWVAAGNSLFATSADGLTWNPTPIVALLNSVLYTGTEYVMSGVSSFSPGTIYTSPDATTWTVKSTYQKLTALARSTADGRLAAIGQTTGSLASIDGGLTWQYGGLTSLSGNLFLDLEWFPATGAFFASVQEGANRGIYSSTDGLAWTRVANLSFEKIGASPTMLVNVGASSLGGGIASSPDGVNWTLRTSPTANFLQDVYWTGSQFVAVGASGTIITSADGMSWALRTSSATSGINAVLRGAASSPSLLVVVGDGGTILTSDSGISWVQRSSSTLFPLRRVTWTGTEFVAVGGDGIVVRSPNGIDWSTQATPYTNPLFGSDPYNLNDLVWTGSSGRVVAVGDRGLVTTSP